jgi:hypothetical protein
VFDVEADTLRRLYVEQHLDEVQIAARYAVPPYQVRPGARVGCSPSWRVRTIVQEMSR